MSKKKKNQAMDAAKTSATQSQSQQKNKQQSGQMHDENNCAR